MSHKTGTTAERDGDGELVGVVADADLNDDEETTADAADACDAVAGVRVSCKVDVAVGRDGWGIGMEVVDWIGVDGWTRGGVQPGHHRRAWLMHVSMAQPEPQQGKHSPK